MGRARGAPVFIRRATTADRRAITRIVRSAGINPTGLRWPRFLLAESAGQAIGTVQLKPHNDGSLELASLAVVPARQGEGIAGALIDAVLRGAAPPIYLICASHLAAFYPRFGFRALQRAEMPPELRWLHRIINTFTALARSDTTLLVMRWDGASAKAEG